MMLVTVSTLFNRASRKVEVYFSAPECGSSESSELWIGETSGELLVIDPSHYYDESLRRRRNTDNMLSPWQPTERIALIGQVWSAPPSASSPDVICIGIAVVEAGVYA